MERIIYSKNKVYVPQKKIRYTTNKHGAWETVTFYDEDGEKVLEEHINEGVLNYRCEFLNGKKHGTEICHDDDGNKLVFHYLNGKKIN